MMDILYQTLSLRVTDISLEIQNSLCKPGPDLVVCDEGHRIKNNQANISQALKKIHTRYCTYKI